MEPKKYLVISSGQVLPGYTVEQVAENLAKLYKKPPEKVTEMLISGEPRKVKSVDTRAKAHSQCAKLNSLGLNCSFIESKGDEPDLPSVYSRASYMVEEGSAPEKLYEMSPEYSERPSHSELDLEAYSGLEIDTAPIVRRKLFIFLGVLLALLMAGMLVFYLLFNGKAPKRVGEIESALLDLKQPSVFMYANLAQLKRLTNIGGQGQLEGDSLGFLAAIQFLEPLGSTSYLFQQTDFVSARLRLINAKGSSAKNSSGARPQEWLTVLTGNFKPVQVEREFSTLYKVSSLEPGFFKLKQNAKMVDGVLCPLVPKEQTSSLELIAHIADSQIIIASSKSQIRSLLRNLELGAADTSEALPAWQAYRDDALLAVRVFDAKALEQNMVAKAALTQLSPNAQLDSLGLRLESDLFNRGVKLELNGYSGNSKLLDDISTTITNGIQTTLVENQESLPSLAKLLARVDVSRSAGDSESLSIVASLDSGLLDDVKSLLSDGFGELMGASMTSSAEVGAERIDDAPWNYALNQSFLTPQPSKADTFDKFLPLTRQNGVSLFIDSLGIKPVSQFSNGASDLAMQLSIKARRDAPKIENSMNWGQSGIRQQLMISEVLNSKNEQLVDDERCKESSFTPLKNHLPADQAQINASKIDTSKTVRLLQGTGIDDVDRVKGWYELKVPTSVTSKNLSMQGEREVAWQNGSLRLTSINNGNVSYVVEGDQTDLINVRALNANGQALSFTSSMSGGKKFSKNFQGQVASIDVFTAEQWESVRFDFDLNTVTPKVVRQPKLFKQKQEVGTFSKADRRKYRRALSLSKLSQDQKKDLTRELQWKGISLDASQEHEIGRTKSKSAHILFKHDVANRWNKRLEGIVIVPFNEAILVSPQIMSMRLNVDGQDLSTIIPSFSANRLNGKYTPSIESDGIGYLIGSFSAELDKNVSEIRQIKGVIEYAFPSILSSIIVDLSQASSKSTVTLANLDYGWQQKSTYAVAKNISNVYSAKLISKSGSEHIAEVSKSVNGQVNLAFDFLEEAKKVELYLLKDTHKISETFKLKPSYR